MAKENKVFLIDDDYSEMLAYGVNNWSRMKSESHDLKI